MKRTFLFFKLFQNLFCAFLLLAQNCLSEEVKGSQNKINLDELVYPSELGNMPKMAGAVYYSGSQKNKVLMPTQIWGSVGRSGLHFVPTDINLIKALTTAGGLTSESDMAYVKVTRLVDHEYKTFTFDVSDGGDQEAHEFVLHPGDTIFVPRQRFYENRAYYTSLFGVFATILSSILLWRQVKKNP